MAELADAPDLGSGVPDVQVQVLSSASSKECVESGLVVHACVNLFKGPVIRIELF